MSRAIGLGWAALSAGLLLAAPAFAAGPPVAIPESQRAIAGGRGLEVTVPQAELGANINASNLDMAMGGGVLGVLIDAKIEADRGKRSKALITPLREALDDVDADELAIETAASAAAATPWLEAAKPDFARDPTDAAKSAVLTASPASQVVFLDYVYDTPPDLSAIRVGVRIVIANKAAAAGAKPESRLSPRNLVYAQTLTSVVRLPNAGAAQDNGARWAAGDGALARKALAAGFARIGALIPRALSLTDADLARMNAGEKQSVAGYSGRLVDVQTLQQ